MKKEAGVWIDQTKAVIFILADEGAEIKRIRSGVTIDAHALSVAQKGSAAAQSDNQSSGQVGNYYAEVLSCLRGAESILIFGPGEAKLELKKRLEVMGLDGRIVGFESVFNMTDSEIVAKVRQRFLK